MPDDAMDDSSQFNDMMEAEQTTPPPPLPPQVEVLDSGLNQANDQWRSVLNSVRKLVEEGKPSYALQELVMAARVHGGEGAVAEMMRRAQEICHEKVTRSSIVDELATLFAECAIAENRMHSTEPPSILSQRSTEPDEHETSILSQTGRKQIVIDALSDGSSFVCVRCGGLVSILRKDEHFAYWCCKNL